MINADVIQELKKKADIIKLFNHYNIQVTQKGKKHLALCPFHKETEPSLSITPGKNLWKCFGCDTGGDAINFIQRMENIPFVEAVYKFAELEGLPKEKLTLRAPDYESGTQNKTELPSDTELLNKVAGFYHRTFTEVSNGKMYLESRGIKGENLFRTYKIGYVNGTLLNSIPTNDELKQQLINLGILLENGTERFINCVVFPIFDDKDNCISFYGRHTKIKKGGHFYLPGERQGLFNQKQLLKEKAGATSSELIITESIIDAFTFIYQGQTNILPAYGNNGLNENHLNLIKNLKPKQIILALDGDDQGQKATIRMQDELNRSLAYSFNCRKVIFPKDQDPNEYFLSHTLMDFEVLLNNQTKNSKPVSEKPVLEYRLQPTQSTSPDLSKKYQIRFAELRSGQLNVTINSKNPDSGRMILDKFNLYSQRHREQLSKQIAAVHGLSELDAEKEVLELITLSEEKARYFKEHGQEEDSEPNEPQLLTPDEEKEAIEFLKSPDLLDQIVQDYEKIGYIGEEINKKIAYLVMTSRKMDNPLSLVIMSNSAAGKSSLQKATLEFCPEDESKHYTRLTQQALNYIGQETLKHKFLSIEEEEGSSDASYNIKVLLSAKQLVVMATDTDQTTGKKKATDYITEGPVAVMLSTTSPDLEAEFASRTLVISIDESSEQTKNIHNQQKYRRTHIGQKKCDKRDQIIQKHRNAQWLLDSELRIINNFAPQLEFPTNRLRYRRSHEQYLDLIESIAFVKQHQKTLRACDEIGNYIEVDRKDIRIANEIFTEVMGWTIDELKPPVRKLLNLLWDYTKETGQIRFERREIREQFKIDNMTLHRYLSKLIELDYVRAITAPTGCKHQYELLYDGEGSEGQKFIIGLKNPDELKDPKDYDS